jgi:2-dehydropantoate 2-reductase
LPYGKLNQIKEAVECGAAAVAEAIAVAHANGVDLTGVVPHEIWNKATEGLPFDFKTSMLQDIEKGSRTEIDFINGAVVRFGERVGVPTPVNRTLVAGIKGIEFSLKKG